MPYEWTPRPPHDDPQWQLSLWPYRSLLRKHFVIFIGATIALCAFPLLMFLGNAVLWGLLPFFALVISGLWYALHVSYRRGELLEQLTVDESHARLTRHNPNGDVQDWQANRYWVTAHLHPKGGPVENYITLRGGDREVEIGAFLDADERLVLYDDLRQALRAGQLR